MNTHKSSLVVAVAAISLSFSSVYANLVDLNVEAVVNQIGTTGTPSVNVTPPVVGQFATYDMTGTDGDSNPLEAFIRVELMSSTNLGAHRVHLGQNGTGLIAAAIFAATTGDVSATYRFSFFNDDAGALGSALSIETITQILDIDNVEKVTVNPFGITQVGTALTSNITLLDTGTQLQIGATVDNKPKTNSAAAVNLYSSSAPYFELTLQGINISESKGREFQFDFNNPPTVALPDEVLTTVPESSSYALLAGLTAVAFVALRRR
ncbi:MAG: PEP-CTERM sorting domain-containing protein [Opitutaceae bacterium]